MISRNSVALAAALALVALAACGPPEPNRDRRLVQLDRHTSELLAQARSDLARSGPIKIAATSAPEGDGTRSGSMTQFAQVVLANVSDFWAQTFASSGLAWQPLQYAILDAGATPMTSNCPGPLAAPDGVPFYCSEGGRLHDGSTTTQPVVYIGAPWLWHSMSAVDPANFDFAAASVIAHELGHHVQQQLLRSGGMSPGALPGKFNELSADCLGGVWANAAYHRGQLAAGDVEEAQLAAWNAGSDLPDDESPDPHGTREERVEAFNRGYSSGAPMTCLHL